MHTVAVVATRAWVAAPSQEREGWTGRVSRRGFEPTELGMDMRFLLRDRGQGKDFYALDLTSGRACEGLAAESSRLHNAQTPGSSLPLRGPLGRWRIVWFSQTLAGAGRACVPATSTAALPTSRRPPGRGRFNERWRRPRDLRMLGPGARARKVRRTQGPDSGSSQGPRCSDIDPGSKINRKAGH